MFGANRSVVSLVMILVLCWLLLSSALAHQLRVFAAVEGEVISGYVYFGGGAKVADAQVTLFNAQGVRLSETTTQADSTFRFTVTRPSDYRIVADAGAGHVAEFLIMADEFSVLPNTSTDSSVNDKSAASSIVVETASASSLNTPSADLQKTLEQIVASQIRPLRKQLDAYERKVRWHDVLGGIGYIFGLAGISFYWLGRNRQPRRS